MAKTKTTVQQALSIRRREEQGTRPVRRLRREGLVPGVVYGRDMEPLAVSVNQRELTRLLHSKRGEHSLVTLCLEDLAASPKNVGGAPASPPPSGGAGRQAGVQSWEKPALIHALQHDPVDGHVVHVDFHAIRLTERVKVKVPVVLTGEPMGVKQEGGILEHFLREVEVECLPTEIPTGVAFDVSAMKTGETIHVRDLMPPTGAKILSDAEGVIVSVQKPREEKPEEETGATEPEVIREKKPETETPGETDAAKGGRSGAAEGRTGEKPEKSEAKKEK